MTVFTDVSAAIDEAVFCAQNERQVQAITLLGCGLSVQALPDAQQQGCRILETVHPVEATS